MSSSFYGHGAYSNAGFCMWFVLGEIEMMSLLPLYHGFKLNLRKFLCLVISGQERKVPWAVNIYVLNWMKKAMNVIY